MASALLMEISKDEDERARLMSRKKYETDLYSNIATAKDRGMREGKIEGKVETSNDVLALIRQGLSTTEIEKILTERLAAMPPQ